MEQNTLFALVAGALGLSDIVLARVLVGRISSMGQKLLTYGGVAFLLLAALFALRVIKV